MMPGDRRNDETALVENCMRHEIWLDLRGNIVRLDGDRCGKIVQVSKCSMFAEYQVEKSAGGWEICVFMRRSRARRSPDLENNRVSTRYGTRLEQARKFTCMIDVQVGQKNDVGVRQRQLGFTEPNKCAGAGINEYPRSSLDQHEIARCGAPGGSGAARPEHPEFKRRG
jgi:hypothetical protein